MSVAPFLQKTYEIFSDSSLEDICSWGENNDSIFIKNIEEFARVVLPRYFKHSNYSSFTRQLHKYDFHKTIHNPKHGEFKHPNFIKGRPELMKLIQRKIYVSKQAPSIDTSGNTDGETDGSTDKDGSNSSDKGGDFEIDLLDDMGDTEMELDFDQFDEIEASVERGIIAFDDERISILEKRQADLIEDNKRTRDEIIETVQNNDKMVKVMDCMLNHAMNPSNNHSNTIEVPDDMDDLCDVMKSQCTLGDKSDLQSDVMSFLSTFE